jgi:DNA-directed RNA polymerase subunit beta'
LIPAGTGLAYHARRKSTAGGLTESEMETLAGVSSAFEETPAGEPTNG